MEVTMHEKIITQLQESLRATFAPVDALELALQMLAWAKLSSTEELPEDLRLNASMLNETSRLPGILERLAHEEGLIGQAFAKSQDWSRLDHRALQPALDLLLQLEQAGLLRSLAFDPVSVIGPIAQKLGHESCIPPEVCSLLAHLADVHSGESVYVPWDSWGTIAASVSSADADVYLETPMFSSFPALISLLNDKPFQVRYADPIRSPSAVENGQLRQFKAAIAFPPLGQRYSADATNSDWFARFPEQTTSGSVLTVRHLLSQACHRVVVAIPNSLLFGAGAERTMREDLIREGQIESVIAMPAGLLPSTNVAFSILVLTPSGGPGEIQFFNADTPRYREPVSKAKCRLINIDELVERIASRAASDDQSIVSVADVINNDAQLQVSRYVLPDATKQLKDMLVRSAKSATLKDMLRSTVRPMPVTSQEESSVEVHEVGVADLPPYGYINTPGRTLRVEQVTLTKNVHQFLQPLDIVLIIKGSVGKVGIVTRDVPPPGPGGWIAGPSAIVLRADPQIIDPRILFLQLRSEFGQAMLSGITSGASIQLIQLRELERLPLFLPALATGHQAAEALEKEALIQREIDKLRQEQSQVAANLWTLADVL